MYGAGILSLIHPTAIIDPTAELDAGVEVGAFSIVGPAVRIGRGTRVGPHAVLRGPSDIGEDNRIFQFASVGEDPQDKKYGGEATRLTMGHRNVVREGATIHRGTVQDAGATTITVEVSGNTLSVIPGWTPQVVQRAVQQTERITR